MQATTTTAELYAPANRMYSRLEREDRERYEAWLLVQGVRVVAEEVTVERGLEERAAAYFIDGFTGRDAAISNPRVDGMEPAFREGRSARQVKGIAQRCRAAAAGLRAKEGCTFEDWLQIAYQVRPVSWRMPLLG